MDRSAFSSTGICWRLWWMLFFLILLRNFQLPVSEIAFKRWKIFHIRQSAKTFVYSMDDVRVCRCYGVESSIIDENHRLPSYFGASTTLDSYWDLKGSIIIFLRKSYLFFWINLRDSTPALCGFEKTGRAHGTSSMRCSVFLSSPRFRPP